MNKQKIKDALKQALKNTKQVPPGQKKPKRTPVLTLIIICLLIFALQYTTTIFSSSPQPIPANIIKPNPVPVILPDPTKPRGRIISPVESTETGNEVTVICETNNIEPGSYIWLAVDKPELDLCWAKAFSLPINTRIQTTIHEGGPKGLYRLSLYILNENYNAQWQDWKKHEIFGGLHMPPDAKRLSSVMLVLKP